jgi:hypothetical protein
VTATPEPNQSSVLVTAYTLSGGAAISMRAEPSIISSASTVSTAEMRPLCDQDRTPVPGTVTALVTLS